MSADFKPAENATTRFSNRVDDYARYRPGYPVALLDTLTAQFGMQASQQVVDIGAGTGILTRMLLDRGHAVIAVDPNADMLRVAEQAFAGNTRFVAVVAPAEKTGLPDGCCDWITAAQAFHWFAPDAFRTECRRLLRPGGYVVLVWNNRIDLSPLMLGYKAIIDQFNTDYERVRHESHSSVERIRDFFGGESAFEILIFDNTQPIDRDAFIGRAMSASYMPPRDDPRSGEVIAALNQLFDQHEKGGLVQMAYETRAFVGRL